MAQFVNQDESVEMYPGQVQYFFTYHLNLSNGIAKHKLLYIRWYQTVNFATVRYNFSINNAETCNVEL